MSDRQKMLELLQERGPRGASTLEMRRMGLSGNPSQRRAELVARGFQIDVEPYKEGRRRGRRYVLISGPQESAPSTPGVTSAPDHAGSAVGGSEGPAPDHTEPSPADSSGLFDASEFKRKRQHDQEAA